MAKTLISMYNNLCEIFVRLKHEVFLYTWEISLSCYFSAIKYTCWLWKTETNHHSISKFPKFKMLSFCEIGAWKGILNI